MKEFDKWWKNKDVEDIYLKDEIEFQDVENIAIDSWRAGLGWANKLFLDGMHPQDVIFSIQKELED